MSTEHLKTMFLEYMTHESKEGREKVLAGSEGVDRDGDDMRLRNVGRILHVHSKSILILFLLD